MIVKWCNHNDLSGQLRGEMGERIIEFIRKKIMQKKQQNVEFDVRECSPVV